MQRLKKNVEVLIPENTVRRAGTRALYKRFNDPRFERPRMNIVPASTKNVFTFRGGGGVGSGFSSFVSTLMWAARQ